MPEAIKGMNGAPKKEDMFKVCDGSVGLILKTE